MVKLYLQKITNREINPFTNDVWALDDVPEMWRDEVQNLLEAQGD